MVGNATAQPTIGVSSLKTATGFYGGVLGLRVLEESPYEVVYASGNGKLSVYVTKLAGTNKATYATWEVDDMDAEIAGLEAKDVVFEHYDDMPGVKREGEVHMLGDGGEKAAWFKDPDGNILCLHTLP